MAKKTTIYELIDQQCTADQIADILRKYKNINEVNRKEILVGGVKADVLQHLKTAVGRNMVPFPDVLELLRESEENGDQHIFYFAPANAKIRDRCRVGGNVAGLLWGEEWDYMGFPLFDRVPESYTWADFRQGITGKPHDWVIKLYGHEVHDYFVRQVRDEEGDLIKYFKREIARTVCLARWNDPGLMELRVPRASSQGTVKNRLDIMWEQLSPAFTPNDFVPWNLQRARRQLLADRKNHSDCYRAGTLEFVDSDSGKACFYPSTEDEGADGVAERVAAIDAYLAADESECHEVKITWLPKGSGGKLKDELRIVCGGKNSHEVVIAARTNSQAVDYVTSRLREFSRPSA